MTRWCKLLTAEARVHWEWPVEVLRRCDGGWQLEGHDGLQERIFDAVLLALPPAQAATMLAPHQREWAQRASLMPMQPCWTLMGVTEPLPGWRSWDAARPAPGALGLVLRNDGRPGREERRDEAHWVLHAKPGWSRTHLEDDASWVQQALQDALGEWLRVPLRWRHALAHRWRYAQPHTGHHALRPGAWWDAGLRLGVCGDFLGGAGGGVEAAWCSAQALAKRVLRHGGDELESAEEMPDAPAAVSAASPAPAAAYP
jgi:predicted NAD/FAD-dependent oxidoreductase